MDRRNSRERDDKLSVCRTSDSSRKLGAHPAFVLFMREKVKVKVKVNFTL